jgi:hypothetical protein
MYGVQLKGQIAPEPAPAMALPTCPTAPDQLIRQETRPIFAVY